MWLGNGGKAQQGDLQKQLMLQVHESQTMLKINVLKRKEASNSSYSKQSMEGYSKN